MGLDIYAYAPKTVIEEKCNGIDYYSHLNTGKCKFTLGLGHEFYYWRKHARLHNYFYDLFLEKGGKWLDKKFPFCWDTLCLDTLDLHHLHKAIVNDKLPFHAERRHGWVMESDKPSKLTRDHDLKFIWTAEQKIKEGHHIYVMSSW